MVGMASTNRSMASVLAHLVMPAAVASALVCGVFSWMLVARMAAMRSFADATLFTLKLFVPAFLVLLAISLVGRALGQVLSRRPGVRRQWGWWAAIAPSTAFLALVVTVVGLQPFWAGQMAHLWSLIGAMLLALAASWFASGLLARMPWGLLPVLALLLMLLPGAAAGGAQRDQGSVATAAEVGRPALDGREVILIGLDGATFDVIDPMIARGELPHLAALIKGGSSATLRSEMAPNQPFANSASKGMRTPVIWETIISGHRPSDHGVWDFYFTRIPGLSEPLPFRLPLPKAVGAWLGAREKPVYATDPRERRMWEIVGDFLPDSLVVGWVDSWPAFGPAHCQLVSDRAHYDEHGLAVPEDLAERYGWYYRDLPRLAEEVFGETFDPHFADEWDSSHPEYVRNKELLDRLQKGEERDAWYRSGLLRDTAREVLGFELDPDYESNFTQDDPRYWEHHLVANESKDIARDAFYGKVVVELLDERLAAGEGLPSFTAAYFPSTDTAQHWLWKFHEPEAFEDVDPGSVERLGDAIHDVYRHADAIVGEIMARADEDTTIVIVSDHGGGAWIEQGGATIFGGTELHQGYSGNHRDNGIFIARGPGIRAGARLDDLVLYDIAPLVLHLLDLPLSEAMPGELRRDMFEEGSIAAREPRAIADYGPRILPEDVLEQVRRGSRGDQQYMDKLAELGYADGDEAAPAGPAEAGP